MKKVLLGKCPICGEKLNVSELKCNCCNSKISGDFELSQFDYLSQDEQQFALVFLKNAGNISLIEKELNISYPTVKKYLEMVQTDLGFKKNTKFSEEKLTKDTILLKLKNNEITFDEAEELLKEI